MSNKNYAKAMEKAREVEAVVDQVEVGEEPAPDFDWTGANTKVLRDDFKALQTFIGKTLPKEKKLVENLTNSFFHNVIPVLAKSSNQIMTLETYRKALFGVVGYDLDAGVARDKIAKEQNMPQLHKSLMERSNVAIYGAALVYNFPNDFFLNDGSKKFADRCEADQKVDLKNGLGEVWAVNRVRKPENKIKDQQTGEVIGSEPRTIDNDPYAEHLTRLSHKAIISYAGLKGLAARSQGGSRAGHVKKENAEHVSMGTLKDNCEGKLTGSTLQLESFTLPQLEAIQDAAFVIEHISKTTEEIDEIDLSQVKLEIGKRIAAQKDKLAEIAA
jgi:hypothetical protein